jgi:predicted Rossmann fold flavoprotein
VKGREERRDVVVLGAGAAGLFCAAACGRRGRSVLVLDHAREAAAKVRVSGGGRCNFTNLAAGPEHYLSRNPQFCRSALARFTPAAMLALAAHHGVRAEEREPGRFFCAGSAREIVALLERECREAGAAVALGTRVEEVRRDAGFVVVTSAGRVRCSSLVVATGGLSYPALGASGLGYEIARQFGLGVVETRPALVPFVFPEPQRAFFRDLAGVSLEAEVSCGGRRWRGKVLFTHRGLSGPAVLQASLLWRPRDAVVVDLLPGDDVLPALLARRRSRALVGTVLAERLPRRFALAWCGPAAARPLGSVPERELRELAARLHAWEVRPGGTEGYRTAEATAGGVDTDALSSRTMEAREAPGLYFAGEVVDVTGEVGGYNLQWAWASGRAAGEHA